MRRLAIGIVGIVVVLAIIGARGGAKNVTATPTVDAVATGAAAQATIIRGTHLIDDATAAAQSTTTATAIPETPPPLATSAPTPMVLQVVTVKDEAVNLRQSADVAAAVVTLVPPGTDATVIGEDTTGPDGVTRYVHARVGDNEGYLRSDLVSAPHEVTPVPPTPIPPTAAPDYYADYPLIDAADLSKRPDHYKGLRFSVIGKAFNVHEQGGVTTFQMQAETSGYATVAIVLVFNATYQELQDGIRLRAYCVGAGSTSGTNGFGANVVEPLVRADRVGPPNTFSSNAEASAISSRDNATIAAVTHTVATSYVTQTAFAADTKDRARNADATQQGIAAAGTAGVVSAQTEIAGIGATGTANHLSSDATGTALAKTIGAPATTIALTYAPKPTPKP